MSLRETFLPELEAARRALFQAAADDGTALELADFGGFRTEADTAAILAIRDEEYQQYAAAELAAGRPPLTESAWRPIAPYGQSWHNYGAAFDVVVSSFDPSIFTTPAAALASVAAWAPQLGLSWGGAGGKADTPHFQLAVPLSTACAMWSDYQAASSSSSPRWLDMSLLLVGAGVVVVWMLRRWAL